MFVSVSIQSLYFFLFFIFFIVFNDLRWEVVGRFLLRSSQWIQFYNGIHIDTCMSLCMVLHYVKHDVACGAGTANSSGVLPVFTGVRVARSLVFCVMFCGSLFVVLSFFLWPLCCLSFDLQLLITPLVSSNFWPLTFVVCPSSIYDFWLPLWYLQTFLNLFVMLV